MADDFVPLGVTTELEARIWRDALAQEGVPVLIRPSSGLALTGIGPSLGNVRVFVRAADERRARWIVGEHAVPSPLDPGEASEPAVHPDGTPGE